MLRVLLRLVALLVVLTAAAAPVSAQGRGRAGDFDFWVFSLSWSPSYCEATGNARHDAQCERPFSFVVHGLWPQYDRGFPADCDARTAPPSPEQIRALLDIMPSFGLIRHEWQKHGTCSGLRADSYFTVIRKLFEKVHIPDEFKQTDQPRVVSPAEVERAFIAANRGLDADEVAVLCDSRRLQEVRLCLKKDLSAFTKCPEVDRRACRLDKLYMPASRGGVR